MGSYARVMLIFLRSLDEWRFSPSVTLNTGTTVGFAVEGFPNREDPKLGQIEGGWFRWHASWLWDNPGWGVRLLANRSEGLGGRALLIKVENLVG